MSKRKNVEWLKQRTIHVRGLVPKDHKGRILNPLQVGEKFKGFLNQQLASQGIRGRVISISTIPDYQEYFEYEAEKWELQDLKMLMVGDNEPYLRRKIYPNKWRSQEYIDKQIQKYEDKIETKIVQPITHSGHVFVCFDSVEAANYFLYHYNTNVYDTCKIMCGTITEKFSECFGKNHTEDQN